VDGVLHNVLRIRYRRPREERNNKRVVDAGSLLPPVDRQSFNNILSLTFLTIIVTLMKKKKKKKK
jgi:hypothetical protein